MNGRSCRVIYNSSYFLDKVTVLGLNYEEAIIRILVEAGDKGLALHKIARHVYNTTNTLFDEVGYADVYRIVRGFVYRNSRNSYSLFERTATRGCYRLNRNSGKVSQQLINFNLD